MMGFSGVDSSRPWSIQNWSLSRFTGANVFAFLRSTQHKNGL